MAISSCLLISPKKILILTISSGLGAILLTELMTCLEIFAAFWEVALVTHSLVAAVVAVFLWKKKETRQIFSFFCPPSHRSVSLPFAYLPSLLVLIISTGLAIHHFEDPARLVTWSGKWLLAVTLVPISEELSYRVGLSAILVRYGGAFWGRYFSCLFFTLMHSHLSFDRVFYGNVHLFLGPLLLGVLCEFIYWWSNRIAPAILLHAACNASAMIFTVSGGYWLEALSFLYIR